VTEFELFNGTTPIGGPFFPAGGIGSNDPAQTISFSPVLVSSVDALLLNTAGGTDLIPGIGEIAFGATNIPEPTSLALLAVGLTWLGMLRWRKSALKPRAIND